MIRSGIRPRMWEYNRGRTRPPWGPYSSRVMGVLYGRGWVAVDLVRKRMEKMCGGKWNSIRVILHRLVRSGLVMRDSKGRCTLSEAGRWSTISYRLGVSFVELCVLACACCIQARYARTGKAGFYMRSWFEKIFGMYYSEKYFSTIFSSLAKKGFAARFAKKTLRIHPAVRRDLMEKYGTSFRRLESWAYSVKRREVEILSHALGGFKI